jgi:hypothetical protein
MDKIPLLSKMKGKAKSSEGASPNGTPTPHHVKQAIKNHDAFMTEAKTFLHEFGNKHITAIGHAADLRRNGRPIIHERQHATNVYNNEDYANSVKDINDNYTYKMKGMLEHVGNHRDALKGTQEHAKYAEAFKTYYTLKDLKKWSIDKGYPQESDPAKVLGTFYGHGPLPNRSTEKLEKHQQTVRDKLASLPLSPPPSL